MIGGSQFVQQRGSSATALSTLLFLGVILLLLCSKAYADQCSDILSGGLWDTTTISSETDFRKSVQNWFCRRSASNQSFSIGYEDLNAAYQDASKTSDCENNNFDESIFNRFFGLIRKANGDIVSAWNRCIDSQLGLIAYPIIGAAGDKAILTVAYKPFFAREPNTLIVHVKVISGGTSCSRLNTNTSADSFKLVGKEIVTCQISAQTGATVAATGDGVTVLPPPIVYPRTVIPTPTQPLRTTFYAFGDKSLSVGYTNPNPPQLVVYDEANRAARGLLLGGYALIPEGSPALGVGIVLPRNSGIYWPSSWKIWSALPYDRDTVTKAIVGVWQEPNFQPGEIRLINGNLVFHRTTNADSIIQFTNPLRLVVPNQGNMIGLIMPDLKTIVWSYGAVWYRN